MSRLLLFLLLATRLCAHPVAQGSMEIDAHPDYLTLRARVSNEQIFIAEAFGAPSADLDSAFRKHGDYLLGKISVTAGSNALTGRVTEVSLPEDRTAKGFTHYTLRYDFAPGTATSEITLRQTLLNEIPFAPGNPWEATFIARLKSGTTTLREGALFTHREPLILSLTVASTGSVFGEYLRHGVWHILEGWDHLLFMAALVLAARSFGELIRVVTAFTLAHTLTLTLSVFDLVRLSSRIVEPMIAASIVVVALQNIIRPSQTRGPARLALAFGFGLFHGLGFAGGLLDAMQEMAGTSVTSALCGFSLGVEIGHQAVVLPIFFGMLGIRALLRSPASRERFTTGAIRFGSGAITLAGCVYLIAALRG